MWEQDAFLPGLAIPLNNLGGMLSFLERREEALQAIDEAVGIYRQTGRNTPTPFSLGARIVSGHGFSRPNHNGKKNGFSR